MVVVPWNFCQDYVYVNPNVCASVKVENVIIFINNFSIAEYQWQFRLLYI